MPDTTQITFSGGVNAVTASQNLAANEVQTSTNVDFSLEHGAISCRRGSIVFGSAASTGAIVLVNRNYNNLSSPDSSPWYAIGINGMFVRGTKATSLTLTQISPGNNGSIGGFGGNPGFSSYQNYAYLANGNLAIKDNGTNCYSWLIDEGSNPPLVGMAQSGLAEFLDFNGTFSAQEGAVISANAISTVNPYALNTCTTFNTLISTNTITSTTTGTATITTTVIDNSFDGTRINIVADIIASGTFTSAGVLSTNWDNPSVWTHTGLNELASPTNGTYTNSIGPYGIDYLLIGVSDPDLITRVSRDVSIGDASFSNYWHAETTLQQILDATPDPLAMLLQQQGNSELAKQVEIQSKINSRINQRNSTFPRNTPIGYISPVKAGTIMAWAVPRTDYQFVGGSANPDWSQVRKIRILIEATDSFAAIVGGWQTIGDLNNCLTDTINGYQYCYTLARVENGIVVAEGAPSTFSKPLKCQSAQGDIITGAYNGSSTSGAGYLGIYRQGGLTQDAYLLDYFPITTGVSPFLFSDFGYPDLQIIDHPVLTRNLWGSWPTTGVNAISEPFHDRIFIGTGNSLFWSAPGAPEQIQSTTDVTVSSSDDPIQGLVVWNDLVIVNQDSVYEFDGTFFEGPLQDWSLVKTGCRRGSAAPKTVIKTPYGIVLFGYDGLSLYTPGQGIDQSLDWVYEKIGDAWRGNSVSDPAAIKGSKCPAINFNYISNSLAVFADGKLYLAIPTTGAYPSTVFVIDFAHKVISIYNYSFNLTSMFWDYIANRLVIGDSIGNVYQLESGIVDHSSLGVSSPISWTVKTRAWSSPGDMMLENILIDASGGNTEIVAIVDSTTTNTLGTLTNAIRSWTPESLSASINNNIVFQFSGIQSATQQSVYEIDWETIQQPKKVSFWRTDFDVGGAEGNKIWDVHESTIDNLSFNPVTVVSYVDSIAVMTKTIPGPSNGALLSQHAFPNETYGNVGYSIYSGSGLFKFYGDKNLVRPEPPIVTNYVTTRFQPKHIISYSSDTGGGDRLEAWWNDVLIEMDCRGSTVTGVVYLDEIILTTITLTGSGRKGYNFALPSETYGNVIYVRYTSTNTFKHYQTYFNYRPEPARALFFESTYEVPPSENTIKTWLAELNPLGQNVLCSLYVDGVLSTSTTLTGTLRKMFELTVPNISPSILVGKSLKATYTSSGQFKHYKTSYEMEPKPFTKLNWLVTYRKIGGATQLDMARFWNLDVEGTGTLTSIWRVDNQILSTNTFVLNGSRSYYDSIPFPPGGRGFLFEQEINGSSPFKVWKSNLDIERIGIKGFSRVTIPGQPAQQSGT